MKKVILSTGLALALIASAGAVSTTATPSTHKVYVDGEKANVAAYEIHGNNFFKLRDIAAILNGTDAQFEVTWNGAENRIDLTDDKAYTTVGGELETIPAGTQTANLSTAWVYQDGRPASLTGFEINGNNYYKLRDVADAFDFNVTWDGENQRVDIITTESYVAEDETETPTTPEETEQPNLEYDGTVSLSEFCKQIAPQMEYNQITPEYQRLLDSFSGTPVTVTLDVGFYKARPETLDIIVMVGPNKRSVQGGGDEPFSDTTIITKIKTDSTGHATVTFDIPESVYHLMESAPSSYAFYTLWPVDYQHDVPFTYDGKDYKTLSENLTYDQFQLGEANIPVMNYWQY